MPCRFREVEDPTLFPPPPPPRHLPPPPPPPRIVEQTKEEAEAEKRAFEAEIDRVIEEVRMHCLDLLIAGGALFLQVPCRYSKMIICVQERQRKREMLEAARIQPPQEEDPDHILEPAAESQAPIVPPPPPPPPPALTEEQQAAAAEVRHLCLSTCMPLAVVMRGSCIVRHPAPCAAGCPAEGDRAAEAAGG